MHRSSYWDMSVAYGRHEISDVMVARRSRGGRGGIIVLSNFSKTPHAVEQLIEQQRRILVNGQRLFAFHSC
jgi:hypothetical protein